MLLLKMAHDISSNEQTPLLGTEQTALKNHRACDMPMSDDKPMDHSQLSQSFSDDSDQLGKEAVISYHNICYSITTKEKGVKKEREIIKNLRWECCKVPA